MFCLGQITLTKAYGDPVLRYSCPITYIPVCRNWLLSCKFKIGENDRCIDALSYDSD
jgi:hypothetical protein